MLLKLLNFLFSPELLEFLDRKTESEIGVVANYQLEKAKSERKLLKTSYDSYMVHLTCEKGNGNLLKAVIKDYLRLKEIDYENLIQLPGGFGLLQVGSPVWSKH